MSGSEGGTISSESPRLSSIRLNNSAYGAAITWLRGTQRIAGNLIWYGDFTAIPQTSTQQMGGKGGGGGGEMRSTTYTYTAAFAMALCEGQIQSIGQVWSAKEKTSLGGLGLGVFSGALPQSAWGYLTSKHPGEALSYPGIAYVAAGAFNLGDSANMPNLSFEVRGPKALGLLEIGQPEILDARPDTVLVDMLTDPLSGVGFDGTKIAGLTNYRDYTQAAGFFLSPALTEQSTAADHIKNLMAMTNSDTVWSEGKLKVVPYGDSEITGHGITWTPDVTPLFDLTDDDFIAGAEDDIVRVNRKRPADAFNRVQIEFKNRAMEYNTDIGEAKDQANIAQFGLRPRDPLQMHWITRREMADQIADLIMRRDLYVLNEYEFRLGWRFGMLEAMDIVTLTHDALGLDRQVVRIVSVEEAEDGELSIVAEEMPWALATPARVTRQDASGSTQDFNIAPGNAAPPVIFEPPVSLAGMPSIWLATSGGATWGGAEVWVSQDNATYTRIGVVTQPARHGTTTAALAIGGDPDPINTLAVDLGVSRGIMAGATQQDRDAMATLCWVGGELVAYQHATLTASYRYDLTSLRRGAYGTEIAAHASGVPFVRLDAAVFKYAVDKSLVGKTLYIKLRSFNIYGGALQDLAALTPVSYLVAGAPVGSVAGLMAEQPFTGRSARITWDALDGGNAYKVEVWAANSLRRTVETTDTRFEYSFEDAKADGGPWRTLQFKVYGKTATGLSTIPAVLQLTNPQMAAPSAVTVTALLEGVGIRCAKPAETDYAGCRVWASQTAGFDPDVTPPIYDGPDTNFAWYGLTAGDTWYLRIGLYDVFGTDGMTLSSEQSLAVRGITADPAATLAEINALLQDGSGSAKIELLADRFSIKAPDGTKTPFAVVDTGGGVYKTLLNSDVLIGGNVDIANLKTGDLPSDVIMRLGGGTIQLDGMGEIRVAAGVGANENFVRLHAANIEFMRYIAGVGYVTYNYLSRLETGNANSGETVVIPGYWQAQPRVMVSPASLSLYKTANKDQDQTLNCSAQSLVETSAGSMRWQFIANATLTLGSASGTTSVNETSGTVSSNTWTSATKTTPSNCSTITPSVRLKSLRGNGIGQNYYRSIRWRVEYFNGGSWYAGSWRTVDMGAQTASAITDSALFSFPSSGTWMWRIYAEALDTSGSVFGSITYEYSSFTTATVAGPVYKSGSTASMSLPAYSASGGWEIYSVTRKYQTSYWVAAVGGACSISGPGLSVSVGSGGYASSNSANPNDQTMTAWASKSHVSASYTPSVNLTSSGNNCNYAIRNGYAEISLRRQITNSSTPSNTFEVLSYDWALTSALVLASGVLNWVAIGQ